MKDSVQIRIEAILKKAREGKMPVKNIRTVGTSSLHKIIKTKARADRLMKELKDLN
jgi:hypothetical protein